MPRDYDDEDRPVRRRRQPDDSFGGHFLSGFLVGGAALGASIAIIGGVFWLAFRQPDLSEKEKERRELESSPVYQERKKEMDNFMKGLSKDIIESTK